MASWTRGSEHFRNFRLCFPDQGGRFVFLNWLSLICCLKLLQPRFASHLSPETCAEIKGLVQKVVELLSSEDIAIDERHGPGLYARFLRNLLQSPVLRQGPRHLRMTKSAGATPELSDHTSLAPMLDYPSPVRSGGSLSPLPSQEMISFDMFAPVGVGATDPYFPGLDTASPTLSLTYTADAIPNGRVSSLTGNMPMLDMLMPPLNGDNYLSQVFSGGGSNSNGWGQSNSEYVPSNLW